MNMINFVAYNKLITITNCHPTELLQLKTYLKVAVKNRFFVVQRTKGNWNGMISFINNKNSFSRGLWLQVKYWLTKNNLPYEIKNQTPAALPLLINPIISSNLTLRPNQTIALNKWLRHNGFGIIWAPPSFGKTELAASAIAIINPIKTLFLVNSLDLLLQTQERFKLRLPNKQIGLIGGGRWEPAQITVATVQTLASILKKQKINQPHPQLTKLKQLLNETNLIIVDEVHHSKSQQIRTILTHATASSYRLGLSARPFHTYETNLQEMTADDATILACMGPVVHYETTSELIDKNQLAKPRVLLIPILHPLADKLDWPAARKHLFTNQKLLHTITTLTKNAATANQTTQIIAGSSRAFSQQLYTALKQANINVIELNGSIDKNTRQQARLDLNTNKLQAVVTTTVWDEGVDIPNLRQLILGYGGKSLLKLDQRVGRSLRKKQYGQNVAIIIEFISYGNDYLYKHSLTRLKRYLEEQAYELNLIYPEQHSNYVRRLLKNHATLLTLPDATYYQQLGTTIKNS